MRPRNLKKLMALAIIFCTQVFGQQSVAIHYGAQVPVKELCQSTIIIVDPASNFDPKKDCLDTSNAFAYVSLGEVAPNASYIKAIQPKWILGQNADWKGKIIDQTQEGWQKFFLDQLIEPLWNRGYRGFFFDTLDSYSLAVKDPKLQEQQIKGMLSIIQQIKARHPDAKIILNRGFSLLPHLYSDIYAVLIESLYQGWYQGKGKYEATPPEEQKHLFAEIAKIQSMNIPIIVVDYLPPGEKDKAKALSEKLAREGFIPWITDSKLQSIYLENNSENKELQLNYLKKYVKTDRQLEASQNKNYPEIPRRVLIAYASEGKLPIIFGDPLSIIAPIIEYLGYIPKFLDLKETKTLPTDNFSKDYAGIVLWLDTNIENEEFSTWLVKQVDNKVPLVFLNSFGLPFDSDLLIRLGLHATTDQGTAPSLKITKINPQFIGYESKPPTMPFDFVALRADSSEVLLQVKNSLDQTSDVVAITPWGGYALRPYVIKYMPDEYSMWILNPFEFFSKALRERNFPIPDTTTENGRRLMSVHVDGDGFSYQAKWLGGRTAAEEMRDQIFKVFRVPTSVSVITGEIGPEGSQRKKSPELMQIARSIFALPWVEIASHTFSHPFYWQKSDIRFSMQGEAYGIHIPNYTFNLHKEITGSVDFINKYLTPPDKKCNLFFWSGLADPSEEALALAYKNNLLNINGGERTNIDKFHPTVTHIEPKGLQLGKYYQIFAPIDMDFNYMNGFGGPLYGYERVIQTLQLTDKPRRFKPIDLYYHFYATAFPASMESLKKVYRWALDQSVMNIYVSEYIKKVLDFYQSSIGENKDTWLITTKGDIRELRSAPKLGYPDLVNSANVIGFRKINGDNYIHLGPDKTTKLKYTQTAPNIPFLVEANARVVSFSRKNGQIYISFAGHMPIEFTLANAKNCKFDSRLPLQATSNSDNSMSYKTMGTNNEIHFSC